MRRARATSENINMSEKHLSDSQTLAQVFYYPSDGCFNGFCFREIWQKLSVFGTPECTAYLWKSTDFPRDRPSRIRLGVVSDVDDLLQDRECDIVGGASFLVPDSDRVAGSSDLGFDFTTESNWSGFEAPAKSMFDISSRLLEHHGFDSCVEILQLHVELADRFGAAYGLVDYSSSNDNLEGAVFGSVGYLSKPFHRLIEQSKWHQDGWPNRKARGIFWGNYLSNSMLAQLPEEFLDRYASMALDIGGWQQVYIWKRDNGVFFSLSLDPRWDRDPVGQLSINVENRVNWLVGEFLKAGLL